MSFFKGVIGAFKDAVKAGSDFNPLFEDLIARLEQLESEGKLSSVLTKAEQAYTTEHAAYMAKGIHTDALDSQNEIRALSHFMKVLDQEKDNLEPELKEETIKLLDMRDKMEHILGNIMAKAKEE